MVDGVLHARVLTSAVSTFPCGWPDGTWRSGRFPTHVGMGFIPYLAKRLQNPKMVLGVSKGASAGLTRRAHFGYVQRANANRPRTAIQGQRDLRMQRSIFCSWILTPGVPSFSRWRTHSCLSRPFLLRWRRRGDARPSAVRLVLIPGASASFSETNSRWSWRNTPWNSGDTPSECRGHGWANSPPCPTIFGVYHHSHFFKWGGHAC